MKQIPLLLLIQLVASTAWGECPRYTRQRPRFILTNRDVVVADVLEMRRRDTRTLEWARAAVGIAPAPVRVSAHLGAVMQVLELPCADARSEALTSVASLHYRNPDSALDVTAYVAGLPDYVDAERTDLALGLQVAGAGYVLQLQGVFQAEGSTFGSARVALPDYYVALGVDGSPDQPAQQVLLEGLPIPLLDHLAVTSKLSYLGYESQVVFAPGFRLQTDSIDQRSARARARVWMSVETGVDIDGLGMRYVDGRAGFELVIAQAFALPFGPLVTLSGEGGASGFDGEAFTRASGRRWVTGGWGGGGIGLSGSWGGARLMMSGGRNRAERLSVVPEVLDGTDVRGTMELRLTY